MAARTSCATCVRTVPSLQRIELPGGCTPSAESGEIVAHGDAFAYRAALAPPSAMPAAA